MVKIRSHLLEIINKNLEFKQNYMEFELLDTNFSNFAKYISPNAINIENEVTGAELSYSALVDLLTKLSNINSKLRIYENEIAAYALQKFNKTITFERLEYPYNFVEQLQAEKIAKYELLKWFVERTLDIRKRQIITRKVLGDMAILQTAKTLADMETDNKKVLDLHPSMKLVAISAFESTSSYGTQNGEVYQYSNFKIQIHNLNSDFTIGEKLAERIVSASGNYLSSLPTMQFKFTPLGDYGILKYVTDVFNGNIHEIVDCSEYGLALSPNWQGVTLDIIESRG